MVSESLESRKYEEMMCIKKDTINKVLLGQGRKLFLWRQQWEAQGPPQELSV